MSTPDIPNEKADAVEHASNYEFSLWETVYESFMQASRTLTIRRWFSEEPDAQDRVAVDAESLILTMRPLLLNIAVRPLVRCSLYSLLNMKVHPMESSQLSEPLKSSFSDSFLWNIGGGFLKGNPALSRVFIQEPSSSTPEEDIIFLATNKLAEEMSAKYKKLVREKLLSN